MVLKFFFPVLRITSPDHLDVRTRQSDENVLSLFRFYCDYLGKKGRTNSQLLIIALIAPSHNALDPRGRGDSHMEQMGMLVENFEFNP